ncbi:AI-2E family transporter [Mucilaginibacter arboris]|uniref:AI-2E family transporter n=1 Tax=Mucilaginibacter arboris TaxID=2682090 RepID=A0A7K1SV46_9SPHI|nr:AI-2E family transporter [Mucilaginibacter arboris]MVN21219.1 AI-2E family transporter [Mucilaginibacter arboris]
MLIKQYPFYLKSTVILFGVSLFVMVLYMLADLLVPLGFSILLAILLNPLYNKLRHFKINKVVAIALTLLGLVIFIAAVLYFLSSQMIQFGDTLPALKAKGGQIIIQIEAWIQHTFGMSIQKQMQLLNEAANNNKGLVGQTIGSLFGLFSVLFLIPVYIFLLLFYKKLILNFLYEVFSEENTQSVAEILNQTKTAIQSYIVGLLIEALIVAVLNAAALFLLGVKYALLIGVIGAILNMLPYIGGIIAIALPILIATVTKDGYGTQLGIIIAYSVIQFIDNNILVPRIVSSKVQINALISIIIVLLGGALWGVSGMFLSIPMVAVLKIIFDRIEDLKPWGKLLGDEIPTQHMGQIWKLRRRKKIVA